jgi:Putative Ig domain
MMARLHRPTEGAHSPPVFFSYLAFALASIFVFAGCHGGGSSSGAVTISIVPTATINVDASQVVQLTATVVNDTTNAGVTWLVFNDSSTNPPTCTFVDCGTISNATPFSATYTAPASIPAQETVMIEATSVANTSITKNLSVNLVVSMMFTTLTLPGGENGVPYNQKIAVTGGVTPLVFTVSSGTLPAGLSLGTNGVIAGTPSGSGTSQFTVQVADGATPPLTLTQLFNITIAPSQPISIVTTSLPQGSVGVPYNASISSNGGIPPLTWSLLQGTLPAGLTLTTITTTTGSPPTVMTLGQISGTPLSQGTSNFTVEVQDSSIPIQTATEALSLTINGPSPLTITTASLPDGTTASPYSEAIQATGGASPYTWSVVAGLLPPGLTLNPASGTVSGLPSRVGSSTFTIQVTDSEIPPVSATKTFTISVVANTNIVANNLLVAGPFAFLFRGFGKAAGSPEFPEILTGVFTADGKGTLTSGILDVHSNSVRPNQSFTGSYSMGSDGRGSMTWSIPSGGGTTLTLTFQLALDSAGNMTFTELDNSGNQGSGIILQQSSTTFTAGVFSGDFSFLLPGYDATNKPFAVVGRFNSDGSSLITHSSADVNDAGTTTNFPAVTGVFTNLSANGRGQMNLSFGPNDESFIFYLVSPSEVIILSSQNAVTAPNGTVTVTNLPPFGGIAKRQSGGPFANASLNGEYVVTGSGIDANSDSSVFGSLMLFTPTTSSTGVITPQTFDQNDAGSISAAVPAIGKYVVQATGRATITETTNRLGLAYLVSPTEAFFMGADSAASAGRVELQAGASFSTSSVQGQYTLGGPFLTDAQSTTLSGVASADGAGNITGTTDTESGGGTQGLGEALTATYTVASNGRGVVTAASGAGLPASLALYITSPTDVRLISIDPADTHPEIFIFDF